MSVFSIQLEACDPAHNHFRAYQLDVARDLFGAWLVEVKFGQIGARGRRLVAAPDAEHAARRMVRERLQRRDRAPKRIGVAYRRWNSGIRMPGCRLQRFTGVSFSTRPVQVADRMSPKKSCRPASV